MRKITGKDLKKLGFQKEKDNSDSGHPYHYYTYDIGSNCLLISNANDEKINGGYEIEFFEIQDLKITDLYDLTTLINLLNKISNE